MGVKLNQCVTWSRAARIAGAVIVATLFGLFFLNQRDVRNRAEILKAELLTQLHAESLSVTVCDFSGTTPPSGCGVVLDFDKRSDLRQLIQEGGSAAMPGKEAISTEHLLILDTPALSPEKPQMYLRMVVYEAYPSSLYLHQMTVRSDDAGILRYEVPVLRLKDGARWLVELDGSLPAD